MDNNLLGLGIAPPTWDSILQLAHKDPLVYAILNMYGNASGVDRERFLILCVLGLADRSERLTKELTRCLQEK